MIAQGNTRSRIAVEVGVVRVAQTDHSLQLLRQLHFVLHKQVVGRSVRPVDVVALTVEGGLLQLKAARQLVLRSQTEDALQRFVIIMGTFPHLVIALLLSCLPVGVLRSEIIAIEVEIDMRSWIRNPSCTCTVFVRLVVKVVGVGTLAGVGISLFTGRRVFRRLLGEVSGILRTMCRIVVEIAVEVNIQPVINDPTEGLRNLMTAEPRRHGATCEFQHRVVAFVELLIRIHLPVCGLLIAVRRETRQPSSRYIYIHILAQTILAAQTGRVAHTHALLRVVGDDVHDPCNGIASIQGTCGTWQNLHTLDVVHADTIPAIVTAHTFPVYKQQQVVVAHTVEIDHCTHTVGVSRDVRCQFCKRFLKGRHLRIFQLLCPYHLYRNR